MITRRRAYAWPIAAAGLLAACGIGIASFAEPPVAFDGARAYEHVRQLVAIGPRPPGSPGIRQARQYFRRELAAVGIKAVEQPFTAQTPIGPLEMVNVIATIPGRQPDRLAFAGHYDTKLFREFRFVGANDGGSSAAFLLELARVLKTRQNPLTIELLFFDGEEATVEWTGTDHTYGSRHYVSDAQRAGTLGTLRALVLVDMIGDRDLTIRREARSTRWLTDLIWESARRLRAGAFLPEQLAIEDDHVPFLAAGIPAVDIIDLDYDPYWHTAGDTLERVSARSLQTVGDVVLDALPAIESRLLGAPARPNPAAPGGTRLR